MVRQSARSAFAIWALAVAGVAFAEPQRFAVSIPAGSLPDSLHDLERQTGIDLLYDRSLVAEQHSPAIDGRLTSEGALQRLLGESDLVARRAESGAWIIEPPAAPPLARRDAVVPEILVVGQRSQNADVQRFENDVQPYTIVTSAELAGAHRDNVDQYFQSRITQDTQRVPPELTPAGIAVSQIDLRGLGYNNTLVLVDGRRMPGLPDVGSDLDQADINAIPVHAIKRIEVLTGAAGGIYGFGALGGVVNVVLDRENRGLDLYAIGGISSHGDAGRRGLELSYGYTSRNGRTDVSFFAAHAESDSLPASQRGYEARDRRRSAELAPEDFLSWGLHGNSITVWSPGENLAFKPEFGGAQLSTDHTFLPIGFSGDSTALAAALTQHAGQFDFSLAPSDADRDLGSNPRTQSVILNIRHRFGAGLEAYVDALLLEGRGHSAMPGIEGTGVMLSNSPANPFTDYIFVSFPVSQAGQLVGSRIENSRYTLGLLGELPFEWRGTAEASYGAFRFTLDQSQDFSPQSQLYLYGSPADLTMNPLGNWRMFDEAMSTGRALNTVHANYFNHFHNESLRLAGPVFHTAEGPATLTLVAEHRADDAPENTGYGELEYGGTTTRIDDTEPPRSKSTTSVYSELRTRVFGADAPVAPLRNLEFQLAIRHDDQRDNVPRDPREVDGERLRTEFAGTTYTVGAKVSPWSWLMFRGSYATGDQPPPPSALREAKEQIANRISGTDPQRGGRDLGVDGPILWKAGGYEHLKAAQATTAFLGAVLTPFGDDGASIGFDYSRIRLTRVDTRLLPQTVVDNEGFWPERVERAALTDSDRANGYSVGRIVMLDTRRTNGSGLDVNSLDAHVLWPLQFAGGRLQIYADATYHSKNRTHELFQPDVEYAGYVDGPLKWRANGGFDWSTNALTLGANLQYFDSSLLRPGAPDADTATLIEVQGSQRIPSQTYLDMHLTWRPPASGDKFSVDFGASNVLDKAPPRQTSFFSNEPGYSRYGDPRQRRFDLVLSLHF